ncbi:MAG: HAD family hydrolase [Hyphomicrobiaceae bacterium]|nr:HAD family hydrolase [Hyphomicrobiaceae bacterium]
MPIQLVIFDCDGVLIDSEVISASMLIAELQNHGIEVDLSYVARHFLGRSYAVVLSQIRREFGVVLPEGFEADYRSRLLDAFRRDLKATAGVREVLTNLAVPYALATSSSPSRLQKSLELVGMVELFTDRMTTASEVEHGKPAPDLFLRAADKVGIAPGECLVIEDSLAGVRAGLAAGMEVWQFTGGSHLKGLVPPSDPDAEPHRQFASFADFFYLAPELKRKS